MENITTQMEGQGPFRLLIDPVYGPNSKYFWPGSWMDASDYVSSLVSISPYVSGEEFLELYAERYSGAENYRESMSWPDEDYCDALYDHFHSLYGHVGSWDAPTLFVSAVYRELFNEMFPYQSKLLQLKTILGYESTVEPYLKEGKSEEEAMKAAYSESFEEGEKREGDLSPMTCGVLIHLFVDSTTEVALISELVKVLHRTNIVTRHQKPLKEWLLFELEKRYPTFFLLRAPFFSVLRDENEARTDLHKKKLVLALSLFEIEPKAAEKSFDEALSLGNYGPIVNLIRNHP